MMKADTHQSESAGKPDAGPAPNDRQQGPVLAIIPARGGSKGIPGKNIKPLFGKPLIAWTIEAALAASTVNRVVVSTDDEEIARVSQHYGAEVVHRPAELAGDLASSESALLHVLETLASQQGYRPAVLAFLQCTSPLTLPQDIDGVVSLVLDGDYDSAVTMTSFHRFLWKATADGQWTGVNHDGRQRLMRQQRESELMEVGAVYAMQAAGFLEQRFRFFGRVGAYLLPSSRALEVDEPHDWQLAEMMMQARDRAAAVGQAPPALAEIQAVVTDFDGVLTDNRVLVDQAGNESVTCNRADGWGVSLLRRAGIQVACISTETNPVVKARCEKLRIPYWQGQQDKLAVLKAFLAERGIAPERCLYVGNDTNDLACLMYVGVAVAPRDAVGDVVSVADWQTAAGGGEGVLREIATRLLAERTKHAISD